MPVSASSEAERARLDDPSPGLLAGLRATIARIEDAPPGFASDPAGRRGSVLPLRVPVADAALGGGWPRAGLAELHGSETRGMGAATGLALALAVLFGATRKRPLLWIGTRLALAEAGRLYGPGLSDAGLDPAALLTVDAANLGEAIWAAEEAARSGLPALAVFEARGNPALLALEGTRRLHLRARDARVPLLLLRQGAQAEATAASLRLRVFAHAAAPVPGFSARLVGHPSFRLAVEKAPGRPPQDIIVEWNAHERRFAPPLDSVGSDADARHTPFPALDRPDTPLGTRTRLAIGERRDGSLAARAAGAS